MEHWGGSAEALPGRGAVRRHHAPRPELAKRRVKGSVFNSRVRSSRPHCAERKEQSALGTTPPHPTRGSGTRAGSVSRLSVCGKQAQTTWSHVAKGVDTGCEAKCPFPAARPGPRTTAASLLPRERQFLPPTGRTAGNTVLQEGAELSQRVPCSPGRSHACLVNCPHFKTNPASLGAPTFFLRL